MEIRFSMAYTLSKPAWLGAVVSQAAAPLFVNLGKERGNTLRFTLPKASVKDHDRVIRALLTLDPDATIRTARAVYEGLEDFEKQRGK